MSTFIASLLVSIDGRWQEVDTLLQTASVNQTTNADLHDVLCRSATVLTAAHLEGFIRDAAKAVVEDVNRFSEFRHLPRIPKRTFCRTFIPEDGKDANERTEKMVALLEGLETPLTWESFLFDGRKENHKNPSPTMIEKVARNFGIKKIFRLLASSKLDQVFSATPSEIAALKQDLRSHLNSTTAAYPYTVDASLFDLRDPGTTSGPRTLWESFLDQLMLKRHRIAHGSAYDNVDSATELAITKTKVEILQLGVLLTLCHAIVNGPR